MDKRMVDFIRAMRAAGVRISLAESQDAMYGVEAVGATERDFFRSTLKTTLVKEMRDQKTFDYFFPLFFESNTPPMQNIPDNLSSQDQQLLQQALQSLMGEMQALKQLLQQLIQGKPFSQDQLDQYGQNSGLQQADGMSQRPWLERRMERQMGLQQVQKMMEQLMEQLEQMGMSEDARAELREMLEQNAEGLSEQVSQYVGATLAEQMAQQEPQPKPDLMDVPFSQLSQEEVEQMRDEIRRLAARLRSRASLRQKRAKAGMPDPRKTMRDNMRYDFVPIELKYRNRHVKPALVLICDLSTSMRYCAEFLLTLVYELQDQVRRTNSFIFISDIVDVSMAFHEADSQTAVGRVLTENPPGYYSTDLGNSLNTFQDVHMNTIDSRTTVIILGDGRNNHNDPRLDIAQYMQRRSRRLIWFNPEGENQWGTGDSDMHMYAPISDGVFQVRSLRDLASAVDKILADG
ncbi:MAG: VWA domain-containing protein [Burkholderiales bacterium]|nr:VWA domain-containing protein [Anaerolineae bacterium]